MRPRRIDLNLHLALAPLAATTLLAYVGAVLWSIRISFSSSRMLPRSDWAGFSQYVRLFDTERWMVSIQNLGLLGLVYIAGVLVLGTLLAIFIDQAVRGESWFRTIYLYPFSMSFVVTGLVWQWLFNPDLGIQHAMRAAGFADFSFDWIVRPERVMYTLALALIWQGTGTTMAILLAGLRGVDEEQWKAARLDGIGKARYYRSIVLPQLGPAYVTAFVLLAVNVVRTFDIVAVMTHGGPGYSSDMPAKFIIDHLFERSNIGLASAASVVMLLTVFTVLAPLLYWRSRVQARLAH